MPFRFYSLSEEDQVILRGNTRRCIALIRPCKPLADKLVLAGGVSALLTEDDERIQQQITPLAERNQQQAVQLAELQQAQ